jgi:hypothetical protein
VVKWPWLSTTGCIADRSSPRRSALVTMACGDRRVSKSTEVVVPPRRTVTSGEAVFGDQPDLGGPRFDLHKAATPARQGR